MAGDIIFYQFSRSRVERGDFRDFLGLYGPDRLPTGKRLGEMMDVMMFGIQGWDDDPREIHSIPEIRRFYQSFHDAWPYWLYFCNLETDAFKMMVMCCLPSLEVIQVDGSRKVAVTYEPMDLIHFLGDDFGSMNEMCDRAQMSERQIFDRSKAVFEYFGLPYDSKPPPD